MQLSFLEKSYIIPGVYYLETQNEGMNPIAIRPEITPPLYFSWEDTSNGRTLRLSQIFLDDNELDSRITLNQIPKKIEITSIKGDRYQFIKLTKKIFDEKLKDFVAGGGSLNFEDDKQVQDYYLKTHFTTL